MPYYFGFNPHSFGLFSAKLLNGYCQTLGNNYNGLFGSVFQPVLNNQQPFEKRSLEQNDASNLSKKKKKEVKQDDCFSNTENKFN